MDIDLRDLHYFETAAELGNLGRAAKALFRTQPAITKGIHRLEQALGAELFERAGRGVRLTDTGRALLARARLIRSAVNDTVREIEGFSHGIAGHIRIGVAPTLAQYLLPGACRMLLADGADVTIETRIGIFSVLQDALRNGQIDLAVGPIPQASNEFTAHRLFDDHVVVVAASTHALFRKRVRQQDLLDYRWVLTTASYGTEARNWLERAFELAGLPHPSVQIETDSVTLLPRLIAETSLLSFMTRRNLGSGKVGAPLREVALKATTMTRQFGILYRKGAYLSPATRRLIDILKAHGKRLLRDDKQA